LGCERERLAAGETLDDMLIEAFAVCREAGRRFLGHAALRRAADRRHGAAQRQRSPKWSPAKARRWSPRCRPILNALEGKGVHVVTVNDYLARRDMEWMGPLYMGWADGRRDPERHGRGRAAAAYACDITYGTNNEFGFDYLRDNMRPPPAATTAIPSTYAAVAGARCTSRSSTRSTTSSSTRPARR
jgi:preprotein translocase subunit SecA